MSSFICSPKHFNSVETALKSIISDKDFDTPYSLKPIYPKLFNKSNLNYKELSNQIKDIVDTLRKINVLTVSLQYKDNYIGTLDNEIQKEINYLLTNRNNEQYLSPTALYKALQVINYQIEIEHLTEIRELDTHESNALLFLKEITIAVATFIVTNTEEYNNADWSIH